MGVPPVGQSGLDRTGGLQKIYLLTGLTTSPQVVNKEEVCDVVTIAATAVGVGPGAYYSAGNPQIASGTGGIAGVTTYTVCNWVTSLVPDGYFGLYWS